MWLLSLRLPALLCLSALCHAAVAGVGAGPSNSAIMEVNYWASTEGRREYEYQLLRLALEKTADDYPAYRLRNVDGDLGSLRGRRAIAEGNRVNVYVAPARAEGSELEARIVSIPVPVLGGLMGYRQLIARKDSLPTLASIQSPSELKTLTVGQGRRWPDVDVFLANGYTVNDAGNYTSLFAMLQQGRFDVLSLGIIEARRELSARQSRERGLVLVPDLYLYYPFPVIFHVSASSKPLAQRLEKGLLLALADGSMETLFRTHFGPELAALREEGVRLFVLDNPVPAIDWVPDSLYPPVMRGAPGAGR